MYLKIGEKQYSVSRRVVTEDTIKYLSVTPAPRRGDRQNPDVPR